MLAKISERNKISMKTTTTVIRILSVEKGTLFLFTDEATYARFIAGDDNSEFKAFMIEGLNLADNDIAIICENGVPTKVNIIK